MLAISQVKCFGQRITTLWDSGSNVSLITKKAAAELGLKGKLVTLLITKASNVTDVEESMEYTIPLTDLRSQTWWITVYEIHDITAEVKKTNLDDIGDIFQGLSKNDVRRPSGKVQILIGTDNCSLLPDKVKQVGNLQLMENQFGYCLRGSYPSLGCCEEGFKCNLVGVGSINTRNISIASEDIVSVDTDKSLSKTMEKCFNRKSAGVEYQCNKCGSEDQYKFNEDEQRELDMMEQGLKFDENRNKWTATYPWIRNPSTLPNNFNAAYARLRSLEKRLERKGEEYAKQSYFERC